MGRVGLIAESIVEGSSVSVVEGAVVVIGISISRPLEHGVEGEGSIVVHAIGVGLGRVGIGVESVERGSISMAIGAVVVVGISLSIGRPLVHGADGVGLVSSKGIGIAGVAKSVLAIVGSGEAVAIGTVVGISISISIGSSHKSSKNN